MLILKNINKIYDKNSLKEHHVLKDINLEIDGVGIVAICGESGCGKTTLLNIIAALDKQTSGEVYIDNVIPNDDYRLNNIGLIFQDYLLIEDKTIEENMKLINKNISDKEIDDILDSLHILKYKTKRVCNLSGGEKQRVCIARALVNKPRLLICDEPTGNLDAKNQKEVLECIKALSKHYLVLLVSHNKEIVEEYANRIIYLQDGRIVKDKTITPLKKEQAEVNLVKENHKVKLSKNLFSFKRKTNFIFILFMIFASLFSFTLTSLTFKDYDINNHPNNYLRIQDEDLSLETYEFLFEKYNLCSQRVMQHPVIYLGENKTFSQVINGIYYYRNFTMWDTILPIINTPNKNIIYGRDIEETNECLISKKLLDHFLEESSNNTITLDYVYRSYDDIIGAYFNGDFKIVGIVDSIYEAYYINEEDFDSKFLSKDNFEYSYYKRIKSYDSSLDTKSNIIYINPSYSAFYDKEDNLLKGTFIDDTYYTYVPISGIQDEALIDDKLYAKIFKLEIVYSEDLQALEKDLQKLNVNYTNVKQEFSHNDSILFFMNIMLVSMLISFALLALFLNKDISNLFLDNKQETIVLRSLGVNKYILMRHYFMQVLKKALFSLGIGLIGGILLGFYLKTFNTLTYFAFSINIISVLLTIIVSLLLLSIITAFTVYFRLKDNAVKLKQISKE